MKKLIILLVAFMFGICSVFAQPPGTNRSYVSLIQTMQPIDAPEQTYVICGGVVVNEKRKLIATAWHCVPNHKALLPTLSVNGGPVKLLAFSPEADMAIFEIANLGNAKAPEFATPQRGEMISAFAYFDNFNVSVQSPTPDRFYPPMTIKQTLSWEGKVNAVSKATKRDGLMYEKVVQTDFTWIVVTGNPTQGFSGGPMFDKKGRFVGIISHGNGGFTNVSASSNVELILKGIK